MSLVRLFFLEAILDHNVETDKLNVTIDKLRKYTQVRRLAVRLVGNSTLWLMYDFLPPNSFLISLKTK